MCIMKNFSILFILLKKFDFGDFSGEFSNKNCQKVFKTGCAQKLIRFKRFKKRKVFLFLIFYIVFTFYIRFLKKFPVK